VFERVDMAEYAGAYAQSGAAAAKSFIYRTHAVAFKTLPPQTRHRGSLATPRRRSRGLRSIFTASPYGASAGGSG
jgi:hypothetical protein